MASVRLTGWNEERGGGETPHPAGKFRWLLNGLWLSAAILLALSLSVAVKVVAQEETSAPISGTHDMILIPAGEFVMGNEGDYADEAPRHTVKLSPYYLDEHEVTNAQFDAFVKATDYVTAAEREGHCWAYLRDETDWQYAADTDWRQPQGPNSTIADMMDHPVVCVSWEDATAYAGWAGKRLPSEAEWEYAARAGSPDHFVARTSGIDHGSAQHASSHPAAVSDRSPSSKSHTANAHQASATSGGNEVTIEANVWEGHWPEYNRLDDGFYFTAPAGSFAANRAGVYDMLGNVWEWTGDWYDSAYYSVSPAGNPQGPSSGDNRVARGGSWFCSPNYCGAYSTHYRGASPPDRAFNNVGFRCAADVTSNSK